MKTIKKILVAFGAVLSIGLITSCNNGGNNSGQTESTYDVASAAKRVMLEQDKSESVTADFKVAKTVAYNGKTYNVAWVSDNAVAKVTEITSGDDKDTKTLIAIAYVANQTAAQKVNLTATVSIEGTTETVTKSFEFTVPKFVPSTIAQADKAKADTALTLEGVIVAKEAYSASYKNTNVYLKCDGGGFEAYRLSCTQDQYDNELTVGTSIYVSGKKAYYNGLRELSGCTYNLVQGAEKQTVTATDITELVTAGTGIADTYQCNLVKLTDLEIVSIGTPDSSGQYSIVVGDANDTKKQATVRISKYFFSGKTAEDYAFKDLNLVAGQKITVTGIVGWYNAAQITPISADGIVAGEINYGSGLASAYATAGQTAVGSKVTPSKTITLPSRLKDLGLSGDNYSAYTVEWTSSSEYATISTEAVKAVAAKPATDTTAAVEAEDAYTKYLVTTSQPAEDTTVSLVVKVKDAEGNVVASRTISFTLIAKVTYNTHAEYLAAEKDAELYVKGTVIFVKEKDYKTIYIQDADGKVFYLYFPKAQTGDMITVGKQVGVYGIKTTFNGMEELGSCAYVETIGTETGAAVVTDYTETFSTNGFTALEAADQCKPVSFTGVVKSIANGNFVITVGEKEINVYAGNAKTLPTFVAGDKVKVTGLLGVKVSGSGDTATTTYQVILVNTADMEFNGTDAEKVVSAVKAIKAQFSSDTYVKTTEVTINSKFGTSQTNAVTVAASATTLAYADGKLTITPTATETTETFTFTVTIGEVTSEAQTVTIKSKLPSDGSTVVTAAYTAGTTTNLSATDADANAQSLNLDKTIFDVTATPRVENNNSLYPGLNKSNYIALYANTTSSNTLTISVASGYTIKSIKINFKEHADYAKITAGDSTTAITATDGVYTINSSSFTISHTNTTGQVKINSIEITYATATA